MRSLSRGVARATGGARRLALTTGLALVMVLVLALGTPVAAEDQAVRISGAHLVLTPDADGVAAVHMAAFYNPGETAQSALDVRLPEGYTALAVLRGADVAPGSQTPDGFVDASGLAPGEKLVAVAYRLDWTAEGEARLSWTPGYPVDGLFVLAPLGSLRVADAASGETVAPGQLEMGGRIYDAWAFGSLPADQALTLVLRPNPDPPATGAAEAGGSGRPAVAPGASPGLWQRLMEAPGGSGAAGLAALALVIGLVVLVGLRARRRSPATTAGRPPAPEDRQALIEAVADLDIAFEAGTIDEDGYHREREALLNRLRAVPPGRGGDPR